MKIIPKTNCHNQSQISFSHTPVKTDKQYVKYVTKSSIFPELYQYKYLNCFKTHYKTDYVKKN